MKLVAEAGLWTTGPQLSAPPAVAVLEVAGAVLEWPVGDPAAATPAASSAAKLTFTDVAAADWLWRVVGERGHVAVVEAVNGRSADPQASIDIADLEFSPAGLAPLRRLAIGHWLRRWWPASARDGIADLDIAVLDAELAVLTAAAQDFFAEDTLDSDIDGLLRPHRDALAMHLRDGDPRVAMLVETCAELADWPDLTAEAPAGRRRDDYALAAGAARQDAALVIAAGTASVSWGAVPPGVFDAAEDGIDWSITTDGAGRVLAVVRAAVTAAAAGIAVRIQYSGGTVEGVLADRGTATLPLDITESAAWKQDWTATMVTVGVRDGAAGETREIRDRVRAFTRARLAGDDDAFLAEVLAAESDY